MNILSEKFEGWIREMFAKKQRLEMCYHNLDHTTYMVRKVREIGEFYKFNEEEQEDLFYAAWLHDVGYWDGDAAGHEARGAEIAQATLADFGLPQPRIDRIKKAILATRMPQTPSDLFESIICDADLYHLGSDSLYEQTLLLKCEKEKNGSGPVELKDWLIESREFTKNHRYHTDYAQRFLEPAKKVNLKYLDLKIAQLESEHSHDKDKKKDKKEKKDKSKPERGVETLFRVTSANHMELSAMADTKANIMISVNSIIISIVVTILIRKLEEFPNYTIPAILLISTCLVAMVFAILATRPKVTKGVVTKEDIDNKEGNLLYFGNFYQMSLQDYTSGMNRMLGDADYLYGTMTRDIYYLGKVLGKKYMMLRKSYNVFMFGFIISVLAFLIASLLFEPQQY